MAVNRTPVLKRCRSLGLDPTYLGIDKKSKRELKRSSRKPQRLKKVSKTQKAVSGLYILMPPLPVKS